MTQAGKKKTAIMIGASQGIGASIVRAFLARGYNVVATSRDTGGSIVSITTSLVDHPIAGVTCSVPTITKGGIDAASRNLAMEYAQAGIRFNTVAPDAVDTPMHKDTPKDFMRSLSPMSVIGETRAIADAVLFLTEARQIKGEVLHVDGGAHLGKW